MPEMDTITLDAEVQQLFLEANCEKIQWTTSIDGDFI